LQEIYNSGGYDQSVAEGINQSLSANYTAAQYPTPQMYAGGLRCGCLEYYQDVCRTEFRKVRRNLQEG
jgi:hypothetical protein